MYTLSKEFRFEAAHRLIGYKGVCSNIHGHTWVGEIIVEGSELDDDGFLIDFKRLKQLLDNFIAPYDHAILLSISDNEIMELCDKNRWKYVMCGENPTCEYLAKYIYNLLKDNISFNNTKIKLKSITIKETPTSKCTYEG